MKRISSAIIGLAILQMVMTGCSQTDKKSATAPVSTDTATTAPEPAAITDGSAQTAMKRQEPAETNTPQEPAKTADAPQGINLNSLPDDFVIVNVGSKAITAGDCKRSLKLQQSQLQRRLSMDPMLRANLLMAAKQQNIKLTADESSKLLASAKSQHGANLQKFLADKHLTEAQFAQEIENTGLEFKTASMQLESSLLPQIVSRELLAKAAIDAGRLKEAEQSYAAVSKMKEIAEVRNETQLSEKQLQDELLKGELAKLQLDTIAKGIKIPPGEVKQFYESNKSQLKHNERIRLSTILVIAPEQDIGPIKGIRTQLKEANPKLSDKDLDVAVANFNMQAQNQALIMLGEAKAAGADFAKLANEKTQDPIARIQKRGGDMGWQEKQQLVPDFAKEVWDQKVGTVLPKLVKTAEGYRIIKVTGHEGAGTSPLAEVKDLIEAKLRQDKLNQTVQQWVMQQQKKVKVEFSPKFMALAGPKKPS